MSTPRSGAVQLVGNWGLAISMVAGAVLKPRQPRFLQNFRRQDSAMSDLQISIVVGRGRQYDPGAHLKASAFRVVQSYAPHYHTSLHL